MRKVERLTYEVCFCALRNTPVDLPRAPFDTCIMYYMATIILLTKTTAAQNKVALSYHRVRGQLYLRRLLGQDKNDTILLFG